MTQRLSPSCLALFVCSFLFHTATAQTHVNRTAPADSHAHRKYENTIHLAEFGLLEGYQAEAEGRGVALIVRAGSLADQAGMKTGDILTEIDGTPVHNFKELRQVLGEKDRPASIHFRYWTGTTYEDVQLQHPVRESTPYTRLYSLKLAECYGLEVENYQLSENGGVLIRQINAAHTNLEIGDIIVDANERPVTTWSELFELLGRSAHHLPVQAVPLVVLRRGNRVLVDLQPVICPVRFNEVEARDVPLWGIRQTLHWTPDSAQRTGVLIGQLTRNSPAQHSGLKVGDRLVSINGVLIDNSIDLMQNFAKHGTEEMLNIQVLRGNQLVDIRMPPPTVPKMRKPAPETPAAPEFREETTLQPRVFNVFPNPTSGLFTLEFSAKPGALTVRLFKLNGALLYTEQLDDFQGEYRHRFDFRGEAPGAMVVHIEQGGKVFSKVVLVE